MFRFSRQQFPSAILDELGDAYWLIETTPGRYHLYLTSAQLSKIDSCHWEVSRFITLTRSEWTRLLQRALNKAPP